MHMPLIDWKDSLSVNIAEFDGQHKNLIALINRLHAAMLEGKGKTVLEPILGELLDYTAYHFTAEEKAMKQSLYTDEHRHRKEHTEFVDKVRDFQRQFIQGKLFVSIEIMNFLKDWLFTHILDTDKKFGAYLNTKGMR
jgi:hemerythrin